MALEVRCQSGSSRSAGSGKRNGRRRRRSLVLRGNWVPGRNCYCSCPRPTHGIGGQGIGDGHASSVSSFVVPWCASYLLGIGLGGGQKGSLQRAATTRTAEGKNGGNVRRHSLDRLNASMIKPKKIILHGTWGQRARVAMATVHNIALRFFLVTPEFAFDPGDSASNLAC